MTKKSILYIVRYRTDESFNLKTKFDGQIKAFEALGLSVYYVGFDKENFYLIHGNQKKVIGKTHFNIPAYIHTLYYYEFYKLIGRLIKKKNWTYIYWRNAPCMPSSVALAEKIRKSNTKLIFEYQTFPVKREKQSNILRALYLKLSDHWQKTVDQKVDCFVMIGEDAGGSYCGKPAINIENGIDLSILKKRNFRPDPEAIHLLALASMSYWHGYDRLIRSLAEYKGSQKIVIHMVGGNDGGSLPEWQQLAEKLGVADRVVFHGKLSGEPLDEMFDLCDVGINSLGMYRKGFSVTSELKTREYTARGLAFVCSVEDPGLSNIDSRFWLRVANDETTPDMEEIVSFALRMRKEENCAEQLRAYASKYMTWESQYEKVFDLVRSL